MCLLFFILFFNEKNALNITYQKKDRANTLTQNKNDAMALKTLKMHQQSRCLLVPLAQVEFREK